MSHEFLERKDGMTALRQVYDLNVGSMVGMEHDLACGALGEGPIDASNGYSTDAKIVTQDLTMLRDDKHFFPPYEAAPLVRQDLVARLPDAVEALSLLAGRIDDETMRRLNHQVEGEQRNPAEVASTFLTQLGLTHQRVEAPARSLLGLLWHDSIHRAVGVHAAGVRHWCEDGSCGALSVRVAADFAQYRHRPVGHRPAHY